MYDEMSDDAEVVLPVVKRVAKGATTAKKVKAPTTRSTKRSAVATASTVAVKEAPSTPVVTVPPTDLQVWRHETVTTPAPTPVDVDDEPVDVDDDERVDAVVPVPARGRRLSRPGVVVLGVLALVLAVALVLSQMALGHQNSLAGARTSALAASKTYAVELAGYDYRHLGHDFAVVEANSTPTFRRTFSQAGEALKTTLTRYQATATAKVVSAGIVSATTTRATALVFLTQKIKNSAQSATTSDRSQVEITLVNVHGRWLINNVTLL
jgi:Mce-associated membrane protein